VALFVYALGSLLCSLLPEPAEGSLEE